MTAREFISQYIGVGVDFDGYYGDQCVDLVQFYNRDVIGALPFAGNAKNIWTTYPKDFYVQVANQPNNAPSFGDIVIFDGGVGNGNGHICVALGGNVWTFASLDQNWTPNAPTAVVNHTYANIIGWLSPIQPVAV